MPVLSDRVAVITGGASGIGRATVLRFLDEGAKVVVGDFNAENGQALVDEVGDPDRLRFVRTDVAEEAEVEALIGAAVETFGGLDVLFNNAGVGGAFGPLTEISVDDWDRTFAVLVRSVFIGTKHAARVMIEQGRGGSIINTASVAGLGGGGGPLAYSAAKAAVINLTYCSAVELARHRIRVNAICPGLIHTPLALGRHADRVRERMHESCSRGRTPGCPSTSPGSPCTSPARTARSSPGKRSAPTAACSPPARGCRPHRPVQHDAALRRLRRRDDRPPAGEAPPRRASVSERVFAVSVTLDPAIVDLDRVAGVDGRAWPRRRRTASRASS